LKRISSLDNPVLKSVKGLNRKKNRDKEKSYLIEGYNLVEEALEYGQCIRSVLIRESLLLDRRFKKIISGPFKARGIEMFSVQDEAFQRISGTETSQGMLAVIRRKIWTADEFFLEKGCGNIIVLDRLQDPGNVGTILRTADAAGFQGALILKGTADVYSAKTVRAASGALFRLPLLFSQDSCAASDLLHRYGKQIVVSSPRLGQYYYRCNLKKHVAIVVGNEGGGIDPVLFEKADLRVMIPMMGSSESLNAAVAAGILMYESIRENGGKI
jgi:TrmH family RNA methyltransferase